MELKTAKTRNKNTGMKGRRWRREKDGSRAKGRKEGERRERGVKGGRKEGREGGNHA